MEGVKERGREGRREGGMVKGREEGRAGVTFKHNYN